MGTKRPRHNDSIPESEPRRTPNHPSKRRRSNDFAPPTTKPASINQLKSKIRDLTRALEHSDHLPAGVRIEKERALAGYRQDVEKIHEDKRKSELIKKYHMVRFFGGLLYHCPISIRLRNNSVLNTFGYLKSVRKPPEPSRSSKDASMPPRPIRRNTTNSQARCKTRRSTSTTQSTTPSRRSTGACTRAKGIPAVAVRTPQRGNWWRRNRPCGRSSSDVAPKGRWRRCERGSC